MSDTAAELKVDIVAEDMASAAFQRVERALAGLFRPAQRAGESLSRVARSDAFRAIPVGLERVSRTATTAFRSVGEILPVMGALTGATTLAGLYRLETGFANFGSRLGFTAQRIGLTAGNLQTWSGAASLAGSSAESLQSGMETLGQGMWDAVGGRNPELVAAFQALHISFQDVRGSAKSVDQVLPQIADAIARIHDPFGQATVAVAMFGAAGRDLLPFLRLGSRGMAEYRREAASYGVLNQRGVQAANNLRMAQARLNLAVTGFGYTIAEKLEPVIGPIVTHMADWLAANRGWIGTSIERHVSDLASWLKKLDFHRIAVDAKLFAVALGAIGTAAGWSVMARMLAIPGIARLLGVSPLGAAVGAAAAGVGFAASRGAGRLPEAAWGVLMGAESLNKLDQSIRENIGRHQGPLTPRQFDAVSRSDIGYFMRQGWTRAQADIIEGNLAQESGLNPYRLNATGHYGLAQWDANRQAQFRKVEGVPIWRATRQQQLDFVNWELHHSESKAGGVLHGLSSENDAAVFGRAYERFGPGEEGSRVRYAAGFAGMNLAAPPPARVDIVVRHDNAPAGTHLKVASNAPNVRILEVNTSRAMEPTESSKGY